jgi:hypothetical protein
MKVVPAQNTFFFGSEKMEEAVLIEKCVGCGNCVIYETEGICPIARCSKNLLNGPCGGTTAEGKCEVSKETDCAWHQIFTRRETMGLLDKFEEIKPAKDWSTSWHGGPRKLTREDLMLMETPPPEEEEDKPKGGEK